MLYLTCTMISSVDLAHYVVARAKDLNIWGLWYKNLYGMPFSLSFFSAEIATTKHLSFFFSLPQFQTQIRLLLIRVYSFDALLHCKTELFHF